MNKTLKYILLIFFAAMFFSSCELFDNETAYFNVEGEGYVYYEDTKLPADSARVMVMYHFPSHDILTTIPVEKKYYTDENGYYKIKFLKKVDGENIKYADIGAFDLENGYNTSSFVIFSYDDLKNKNGIIKIDTILISKKLTW